MMQGGDKVISALRAKQEEIIRAAAAFLKQEGEIIMTESKEQCPVDTGSLRSSGYVDEPKHEGNTVRIELGYGGVATKINPISGETTASYAIDVHENLDNYHPVGKAKFLEDPFNAATAGISDRLAKALKEVIS